MAAPLLVSVAWLKEKLAAGVENVKVVDGTWHMPMWKRDADAEYLNQHIGGAVRFNLEEIRDRSSSLPRDIPSPDQFTDQVRKLGINSDDHVIVYDNNANFGLFSAARVWYMFKLFGHDKVSFLDGGLPKWLSEGGDVVSGPQAEVQPGNFTAEYRSDMCWKFDHVLEAYQNNAVQILDARPPGRFNGTDPEPNPKIPSGSIIGTNNVFWRKFIDPDTKTFKSPQQIQEVFASLGVNLDSPIVASCGSGMSACWIHVAAQACGKTVPVYIGSWSEWHKRGPESSKKLGVKGEDLNK